MFGHVVIAVLLGLITAGDAHDPANCGNGSLTAPQGTILSPHYPNKYDNNEDCTWNITVDNGQKIMLRFEAFKTQPGVDELMIKDPYITNGSKKSWYSGSKPSQPPISLNNNLKLRFTSDGSGVRTGFNISYRLACDELATVANGEIRYLDTVDNGYVVQVICDNGYTASAEYLTCDGSGGVAEWSHSDPTCEPTREIKSNSNLAGCGPSELTASQGTILSPNYPNKYNDNEDCTWNITVDNGQKILLRFEAFKTEPGNDTLMIKDPYITNGSKKSWYSGSRPSQPPISLNNNLKLRFSSDGGGTRTGFNISYRLACDELATVTNGEITYLNTLDNGYVVEVICDDQYRASAEYLNTCNGSSGVAEWSHSESLPTCDPMLTGCGPSELTASQGTILSPNYPNKYDDNEDCTWNITVDNGQKIWLRFEKFKTEPGNDTLMIKDPYITNGSKKSWYSGSKPSQPPISLNNNLKLRFSSDGGGTRTGFNISYRLACDELATVSNGEISHRNTVDNGYVVEVNCDAGYTATAEYLNTCDGSSGVAEWSHSEPLPACDSKQGCMDKFEDTHISYGTPLYNPVRLYTEDECKNACRNNATCTGFDFNYDVPPYQNASCWLHGPDAGPRIKPDMNVSHFHDTCKSMSIMPVTLNSPP